LKKTWKATLSLQIAIVFRHISNFFYAKLSFSRQFLTFPRLTFSRQFAIFPTICNPYFLPSCHFPANLIFSRQFFTLSLQIAIVFRHISNFFYAKLSFSRQFDIFPPISYFFPANLSFSH
jgi:hypothetical protein